MYSSGSLQNLDVKLGKYTPTVAGNSVGVLSSRSSSLEPSSPLTGSEATIRCASLQLFLNGYLRASLCD